MAKGKIVVSTGMARKKGMLYYLDKQMNVRETPMSKGGKKGRKVCTKKVKKKTAKKKVVKKTANKKTARQRTVRRTAKKK